MLRILGLTCIFISFISVSAGNPIVGESIDSNTRNSYIYPEKKDLDEVSDAKSKAFKEADILAKDISFQRVIESQSSFVSKVVIDEVAQEYKFPETVDAESQKRSFDKIFSSAMELQSNQNRKSPYKQNMLILVSFSMPDVQIVSLMEEANKTNASVIIRGLIDNDFKKTFEKISQLTNESDFGMSIDPTIFTRFKVETVPTFILPLEEVNQCRDLSECSESKHVLATGSVTIRYFLDLVSRTGDNLERVKADELLKLYEG